MSSSAQQAEKDAVQLTSAEALAMRRRPPVGEASFKRRLSERYAVPGTLVVCHRRTILGTWKACETPFHVYNLGMGGMNFWNLGMTLKPGLKIKLTVLMPKVRAIDVVGVVIWNKEMSRSDPGDDAQAYSQITGVKFVDYDAGAWAVLRKIPQIADAALQENPPSAHPRSQGQSMKPSEPEAPEIAWPESAGGAQMNPCEGP